MAAVVDRLSFRTFLAVSAPGGGDPSVGVGIVAFVLGAVAFWSGILVSVVVLGCLVADVRTLRGDGAWAPSLGWSLAGVAHLVGAVFSPVLVVSIPALSYYLYRRHERLGRP